jgi:hypothetical protein
MHGMLRMVAVALVVTMAAASPDAHGLKVPVAGTGHAAGCHGHGPVTPTPSPTNYRCCVSGHHAAIPNSAFSLQSAASHLCPSDNGKDHGLKFILRHDPAVMIVSSYSPPGAAPLRI